MKVTNKWFNIGVVIVGTLLILRQFSVELSDFVEGLGYGAGIAFELIGVYAMNHLDGPGTHGINCILYIYFCPCEGNCKFSCKKYI